MAQGGAQAEDVGGEGEPERAGFLVGVLEAPPHAALGAGPGGDEVRAGEGAQSVRDVRSVQRWCGVT
ncbi:hypothetical protein [Streptomyces sp. NPDC004658]|uniref:hypothetical protein n=1 Tax=Streptomyces sp. NPDC004658 TaxID=3154672 RepID=UPI0033A4FC35